MQVDTALRILQHGAMIPASKVIAKFKGIRALARLMGMNPSTICRWTKTRGQGGTGGLIPSKHHWKLLRLAKEHKIKLEKAELVQE